jgi:Mrp family chromosome partitioning ATPase
MKSHLLSYDVIAEKSATEPATTSGEGELLRPAVSNCASRFVGLSHRLFLGPDPLKVVALVSCKPSEGVSCLGRSLRRFLALELGFSSILLTAEECLNACRSGASSFTRPPMVPTEHGTVEFLNSAAVQNRVVLIDCPAFSSSAAVLSLAPYVDGVLLVVEDGKRSKAEIDRVVKSIDAAHGRVVGIVLNKRRYLLPNWLYSLLER